MWPEFRIFLPDIEKGRQMRSKRINFITAVIWLSLALSAALPVNAKGCVPDEVERLWENEEDISYIVDFLDYDGNFLDSKICTYGQRLEDIIVPEREEDEEYTYRFTGWQPELCEVVTEGAAYMAVYEKIPKDGSDPELPEISSNSQDKNSPETTGPKSPDQIYSISYEVVPIHIETPVPVPTPVLTPESLDLHVGKIQNITVPVIHTSKTAGENGAENELSAETSSEASQVKNSGASVSAADKILPTDIPGEQAGTGKKQESTEKKTPSEGTGKNEKAGAQAQNADVKACDTQDAGPRKGGGTETGKAEEPVEEKKQAASHASFGRWADTGENGIPVFILLAGILGCCLYIWRREKGN